MSAERDLPRDTIGVEASLARKEHFVAVDERDKRHGRFKEPCGDGAKVVKRGPRVPLAKTQRSQLSQALFLIWGNWKALHPRTFARTVFSTGLCIFSVHRPFSCSLKF